MAMHIEPGTLIHGTLRAQDLISAFFKELERVNPERATELAHEYRALAPFEAGTARWQAAVTLWETDPEIAFLLEQELFDALDTEARKFGLYFGTHEGDGSDFGYWPIDEQA